MTLIYADGVMETTVTTGTGTLSLDGAVAGFRTLVAGIGNGNEGYFRVEAVDARGVPTGEWEVFRGTVTDASPDTVSRTTVLSSSTGSAVSLSAGTKRVMCVNPAATISALVLLQRQTASSSASLDFVTGIDDTYDEYELHFGQFVPATDNTALHFLVSTDGGGTWLGGTNYRYQSLRDRTGAGGAEDVSTGTSQILVLGYGGGSSTGENISGKITSRNLRSTTLYKAFLLHAEVWQEAGDLGYAHGAGGVATQSVVNGLRLKFAGSVNIASGWAALYGVRTKLA